MNQTQKSNEPLSAPFTISSTSFAFKYFINLGNDRFGSMNINEKSNLYEEAEKFCKQYDLDPYIAVLLQSQMFQEVLKIKEQISVRPVQIGNSAGKIQKNKSHTQNSEIPVTIVETDSTRNRNSGSILHQSQPNGKTLQKSARGQNKKSKPKHFEQMFKRHEQIENKKEISRKKSLEKIPFQPIINSLSRKIVDLKRNTMGKNDSFNQRVYSIKLDRSKAKETKENVVPEPIRAKTGRKP